MIVVYRCADREPSAGAALIFDLPPTLARSKIWAGVKSFSHAVSVDSGGTYHHFSKRESVCVQWSCSWTLGLASGVGSPCCVQGPDSIGSPGKSFCCLGITQACPTNEKRRDSHFVHSVRTCEVCVCVFVFVCACDNWVARRACRRLSLK